MNPPNLVNPVPLGFTGNSNKAPSGPVPAGDKSLTSSNVVPTEELLVSKTEQQIENRQAELARLSAKELEEQANKVFDQQGSSVLLNFDLSETGTLRAIQLLDRNTKEVVAQFPSEAVLQVRARIEALLARQEQATQDMNLTGLLFSEEA